MTGNCHAEFLGGNPAAKSQLHKTHNGNFVKVYYRWHPLYNKEIEVVNEIKRGGEQYYQIRLLDSSSTLIPSWMTDMAFCHRFVLRDKAYCSIQALEKLRQLLECLSE